MSTTSEPIVPPKKDFMQLASKLFGARAADQLTLNLESLKTEDYDTGLINDLDAYRQMFELLDLACDVSKELGRYEQATGTSSTFLQKLFEQYRREFPGYYHRQVDPIAEKFMELDNKSTSEFKSEF